MKRLPLEQFLGLLKEKSLLVGIGNRLRGDDGAGVYLLEQLRGKVKAEFLDAGVAPENYLVKIVARSPRTVIFLDAARLGEKPGAMKIIKAEELGEAGISTHTLSPALVIDYLKKELKGVKIFLLGIQPKNCRLGERLSGEVKRAVDDFVRALRTQREKLKT